MTNSFLIRRYLFILLAIFLLNLHNGLLISVSKAATQAPFTTTYDSETFNLGLTEVVTEVESTFQRNIILSQVWDQLILNISVQNLGDPLASVFFQVKTNGAPIQSTFNTLEQVGLVKAFSYQFEISQVLVLALNYTKQTEIHLEILVILDHSVTWRDPNVNFLIQSAELIGLNLLQPFEREILPVLAANHQYQIQPAKFSILEKNLLASTHLYAEIPSGMQLDCTASVTLQGTGINFVTLDEQTLYSDNRNHSINFKFTITEISEEHGLQLTVLIAPDYEGLSGLTRISLSISVSGVLEPFIASSFKDVLGSHPIPGWLMFPIILISLFGVPYYLVYQEHLVDRDENILDPKKQTKL